MLTAERLRELLRYDPETGKFYRRTNAGGSKAGRETGKAKSSRGYAMIRVDNVTYLSHRLAWLYSHGRWPDGVIDHINGDKLDNRLANLRDCSQSQNLGNASGWKNTSGYRGVYFSKPLKKWGAQAHSFGRGIHLGYFENKDEAIAARAAYDEIYFGEFRKGAV